jgi:uncharacterized membrane protein YfcA
MHYLIAGLIGIVTGIVSGLLGVGGGLIMVPAMILLLSPPIRDIKQAIGTSLAVIIPTALIGVWRHHVNHNVDWRVAATLVPTAAVGAWIGAHLVTLIHADDLKRGFGGFLILLGVKLAFFK